MPVSQSASCSSIHVSGLPDRVAEALAGLAAVCREPLASEPCAAVFEEGERRVRESVNALGCEVLGAWIESLDDGALRVDRAGRRRFRVAATPKTIMSTLGPVTYRRGRYRHGGSRVSLVPVDESLGLVNDWLTRPAARLGLMMMGHCTAREAETFFSEVGAMTPSASSLQRLAHSLHERWEGLGPQALVSIRSEEDIPPGAVSASVSLDGVMVALRAGEDGRAEACWREAACGTVSRHPGSSTESQASQGPRRQLKLIPRITSTRSSGATRCKIALFSSPSAAASTIRARRASLCAVLHSPGIRDVLRPERPRTPADLSRPVSRERCPVIGFRSMGHSLAVP